MNEKMASWVDVDNHNDFPLANLPLGVFKTINSEPRVATRIGNSVIDLRAMVELGYIDSKRDLLNKRYLNAFLAEGNESYRNYRKQLQSVFAKENASLRENPEHRGKILHAIERVELLMPVEIGDYTDFYSSIEHATNVGTMFRGKDNALMPNWKHLPVGYHGRSSSINISGTSVIRPKGQMKPDDEALPKFGPTGLLDFELEMGFITGKGNAVGNQISTDAAESHIAGLVLFNDWSARDIQKWEYVPLGPFLGKSFSSTISPWIVTLDALEPFRISGPVQDPEVLPYLQYQGKKNYDINLEVYIQPANQEEQLVCRSNTKYLYWNMCQQLAHQTSNGCNINTGDLYASGTISGPDPSSFGSMLELTWRGSKPIKMNDGTERKFILDGDTVIMRAYAENDDLRIGFGEVRNKVLPAI